MNDGTAIRQVALEREVVAGLYRRLDHELDAAREAHRQALSASIEDPQDLYARDVRVARSARTISERQAAESGLCFGRIDPVAGATVRVGRIGMRDDDGELLMVDWRAEAARPFYAATAASPRGLRRRRHLRLDGRDVVGVSDELLDGSAPTSEDVIGDGPLGEALGRARSGRMREAVATLQSEQDAIVRSEHRGIIVVEGGPGTGKTIVALHRAAYVLYAFERIAAGGVLVYGPHRRFLDYISEVLPSLGENDVELATAEDLLGMRARRAEDPAVAWRRGRAEVAELAADWVRRHQPHGVPLTVTVGGDVLTVDAAVVDRARTAALRDASGHNPAREQFREHMVDELADLMEQHAAKALETIDADVASVLGTDLDRAVLGDLRALGFDEIPGAEGQPEFDRERVRSTLLGDPGVDEMIARVWPRLDPIAALREVLADPAVLGRTLPCSAVEGASRPDAAEISGSDLALLDELRALIDGPPERVFAHVVIDEAQELTEMEWRMLMRRCPARSMTIVGDLAQAGAATSIRSWEAALGPFAGDRFDLHTLTVNYRTTAEILRESAPLLAEIAAEQRVSRSIRHGEVPRTVIAGGVDEAVEALVRREGTTHPGELIGVIGSSARAAALCERLDGSDAVVVPAPEVKGLEFDAVVLVDPAAIRAERPGGARDLYVAMTRATRRLITVQPDDET